MNHSEGLALSNYKSLSTQTRYYAPLLGLLPDNRPVSILSPLSSPPPLSPTPMNHSEGLALSNYKSLSTQTRYYAPLLGLLPDNRPVSIPISPLLPPPPHLHPWTTVRAWHCLTTRVSQHRRGTTPPFWASFLITDLWVFYLPSPPPPPPSPTPMNHSEGLALPNYKSLSTQTRYYAPLLGLLPDNRPVSILSPLSSPPPPPPPSPTPMNHSEGLALPNYKSLSTQTRYYAPLLGLLPDNRPVSILSPLSSPPPPPLSPTPMNHSEGLALPYVLWSLNADTVLRTPPGTTSW